MKERQTVNDVAHMELITSLPVAGDEEAVFTPGWSHFMLVNINREFILGEHIGLIFHFKYHEDIVVEVHIANEVPEEDHAHKSAS